MQMVKQLGTLIEQATNDANPEPPLPQYQKILDLINSRVDMPKHTINGVSKRLSIKNKKVLFFCFDLLEYLSYRCELALYSQISSKEFLLKISGLLMSQDIDPAVHAKILQTIRCWEELFRPHEDLLPMFFQFYAGLLRKDFPIQANYVSVYRPKDFKIYKKTQAKKKQETTDKPSKPRVQPTKTQQKTFEQIRQKLILTNQIIDNANPAQGVKGNELLLQMMQEVKTCEKRINQTINENPNEKIMELALAVNDDIYITYRRFKDLQKNRKPEPFILTELESDRTNQSQVKRQEKKQEKKVEKPAQKPSLPKDIFDNFEQKPTQSLVQPKKQSNIDIFDMISQPKKTEKTQVTLVDFNMQSKQTTTSVQPNNSNVNIFDLLGNNQQAKEAPPTFNNNFTSNNGSFTSNSGFNQSVNSYPNSSINFGVNNPYQSNNFANISLGNNFQTENDIKPYDTKNIIDKITDLADFPDFIKK